MNRVLTGAVATALLGAALAMADIMALEAAQASPGEERV